MQILKVPVLIVLIFVTSKQIFAQADEWHPGIGGFFGYHFLNTESLNTALQLDKKTAFSNKLLISGFTLSMHKGKNGIYLDGITGRDENQNDSVTTEISQKSLVLSYGRTLLKNNDFWMAPGLGVGINWFRLQYQKQHVQNTLFEDLTSEKSNSFNIKTGITPVADAHLRADIGMDQFFRSVFIHAGCQFSLSNYSWQTQNERKIASVPFKTGSIPYIRLSLLL